MIGFKKHTRFDAMTFPEYEFRDYPKAIAVARKLPRNLTDPAELEDGDRHFNVSTGELLAVVEAGVWVSIPRCVVVADEAEERRLLNLTPKPKLVAVTTEEDERASVLRLAEQVGAEIDKRWTTERIRAAVEATLASNGE